MIDITSVKGMYLVRMNPVDAFSAQTVRGAMYDLSFTLTTAEAKDLIVKLQTELAVMEA